MSVEVAIIAPKNREASAAPCLYLLETDTGFTVETVSEDGDLIGDAAPCVSLAEAFSIMVDRLKSLEAAYGTYEVL